VLVQTNGRKSWNMACRIDGKQKFLTGGSYPEIGLREARHWRETVKAQLVLGITPTAPQSGSKADGKPVDDSFEAVALEWYETRLLGWSPRYAGVIMRRMKADIFPVIGREPIGSITPRQMLEALREIEKRGSIEMAHRMKTIAARSSDTRSPMAVAQVIPAATSRRRWPSQSRCSITPRSRSRICRRSS
jgi:hypothetical protein